MAYLPDMGIRFRALPALLSVLALTNACSSSAESASAAAVHEDPGGTNPPPAAPAPGGKATQWLSAFPLLHDVVQGGGTYVAVGELGAVQTSTDAKTWVGRQSGAPASLFGVAWNGSLFAAVGDQSAILTSPDGVTWTARDSGITGLRTLSAITWSGYQFCAVGRGGESAVSTDGIAWSHAVIGGGNIAGPHLYAVASSGTRFMAVGQGTYTSTDCLNWTGAPVSGNGATVLTAVAWSPQLKLWATAGNSPLGDLPVYTSPDAKEWTKHSTGLSDAGILKNGVILDLDWSASLGRFVGVGGATPDRTTPIGLGHGIAGQVPMFSVASADGQTWTSSKPGLPAGVGLSAATCGDACVGVGEVGAILSSVDGSAWQVQRRWPALVSMLHDVAWGDGKFVAVGAQGLAAISTDGWTWSTSKTGAKSDLTRVIWSGKKWLALSGGGASSNVWTSADGQTWSAHDASGSDIGLIQDVTWTGNHFVAGGDEGAIAASVGGAHWQYLGGGRSHNGSAVPTFHSMRWLGDRILATWSLPFGVTGGIQGDHGVAGTSTDGVKWKESAWYGDKLLDAIERSTGMWMAVTSNRSTPLLWSSDQGAMWIPAMVSGGMLGQVTFALNRLCDTGYTAVAVGANPITGRNDLHASLYHTIAGNQWEAARSGTSADLSGIAWNGKIFVAVGGGGYPAVVVAE